MYLPAKNNHHKDSHFGEIEETKTNEDEIPKTQIKERFVPVSKG